MEEPSIFTSRSMRNKPPTVVGEGLSASFDASGVVPTNSSPMALALASAKKGKTAKASGKSKKEPEELTTSEVLSQRLHLVGLVNYMNNNLERPIEAFLLSLQKKHLPIVLRDCAWKGMVELFLLKQERALPHTGKVFRSCSVMTQSVILTFRISFPKIKLSVGACNDL